MYFTIFQDNIGQWRWNLRAANHTIIADSGEGYINKADCAHGIALVQSTTVATPIYAR